MNREVDHIEIKTESMPGMEIIDMGDRQESPPSEVAPGKHAAPASPPADKPKVKRKRRSPEKPWKKPKDMPKRPLSAYNLFFKDERERLLSAGPNKEGKSAVKAAVDESPSPGSRKSKQKKKVSGIGFANLAKTIAAKWKVLPDDVKAPYEKIAAVEKKKYDEAVAIWREKQSAKEKAKPSIKQIPTVEESRRSTMRDPLAPNLFSSDRSLGSFSDASNPYPSEWFHANHDNESPGQDNQEGQVPAVVLTPPGAAAYDRRQYDSSVSNSAWSPPRQDHHYYQGRYGSSDPYMRYATDAHRNTYLNRNLFSQDASTAQAAAPADAHQYYGQGSDYALYYQHHNSRRGGDMRVPRASSLPATRHDQDQSQYHYHRQQRHSSRSQYRDYYHQQAYHQQMQAQQHHSSGDATNQQQDYSQSSMRGSSQHPRSASMPAMHSSTTMEVHAPRQEQQLHDQTTEVVQEGADDSSTYSPESSDVQPTDDPTSLRRNPTMDVEPLPAVPDVTKNNDDPIVESSLHSLTETLDDDVISFITSMKYS